MNVVFVVPQLPSSDDPSLGRFALVQAEALSSAGHHVTLLELVRDERHAISTRRFGNWTILTASYAHIRGLWFLPQVVALLRAVLRLKRTGPVELLHAHITVPAGISTAAVGAVLRIPTVITEHTGPLAGVLSGRTLAATRWAWQRADALLAVSSSLADEMSQVGSVSPLVVHNAVDPSFLCASGERREGFVWVGRGGDSRKNPERALRAFAIAQRHMEPSTIQFVGSRLAGQLKGLATSLALPQVVFCGPLQAGELASVLRRAECLIVSSRYETFGVAAAEALCCGATVAAVDCGGIRDVLGDRDGIIVEQSDEALAAAIRVAGTLVADRDSLALHARQRFAPALLAARLAQIYSDARRAA